jgi:subtilase family serine protease
MIPSGSYILTVIVDSKNQVSECNENNNIKETIITVP